MSVAASRSSAATAVEGLACGGTFVDRGEGRHGGLRRRNAQRRPALIPADRLKSRPDRANPWGYMGISTPRRDLGVPCGLTITLEWLAGKQFPTVTSDAAETLSWRSM
jgi:hypothetical protein